MGRHIFSLKGGKLMYISKIIKYDLISFKSSVSVDRDSMDDKIKQIGKKTILPSGKINYSQFNEKLVKEIASKKEASLPYIDKFLKEARGEKEIVEGLYIVDCLIENGTKGVDKLYPTLSRFNKSESPNIQVFLAGIYRKTQVPDAFGPLCSMLIKNSIKPDKNVNFDPNEEIGGAILEYIRNKNAANAYNH